MASPSDTYIKGIYDRFGYFGTWLPNAPIALGDVGFKQGQTFNRVSSLAGLGIPFTTRTGTSPTKFHYAWHSQLQTGSGLSGSGEIAGTGAEADVVVEFEREGAFVFQADDCIVSEIEDKVALARTVASAREGGTWDPDWSVVDTVVQAGSSTILVANSGNARVEFSAATRVPEIIERLADLQLGLHVRSQKGEVLRLIAEQGLFPLFKLSRLRLSLAARLFGTAKKPVRFGGKTSLPSEGLPPPSEAELWESLAPDPMT